MRIEDPSIGFKWPVSAERVISRSAPQVWEAISRPGSLELCHPFCARNPVHAWPGAGSRDEVHYLNGRVYERHFLQWLDKVGYVLEIGRGGGHKSLVAWQIHPVDAHSCVLRISVCPHILQNLPTLIRWIPHALWVRPRLESYLESVVKGVEWFVVRREPVPRNAFGPHPWFSARDATAE